ncbi:MAG TPA: helix-turn-helix domain-containing protein [Bryobacteraceae bacterium]|nr:helix-turn-helix domain-containing protein [Bryobacteraceae bacterium]
MTFREAQLKLLAYVVDRIHNGELTERGFARLLGISQPHVHNVLKGVRNLSPEIFDSILKYFNMSLLDLASVEEVEANLKKRKALGQVAEAAFLDSPIGPGMPWPEGINWRRSYPLPFPALAIQAGLIMAELANDPYMYETLAGSDIALLDTSARARSDISPVDLYVVSRGGEALVRHIRPGGEGFYLVTDATLDTPALWEKLAIPANEFAGIVKARVRWIGRERDRHLSMHQRGRLL